MDRRRFLEAAGVSTASLMLSSSVFSSTGTSELAAGEGPDWYELTRAVVEKLGGMSRFVKKGARVVIKPNASFDRKPEQAANAHPLVVKAVVEMCLEAGAQSITLFDRNLAEQRRCWMNSGIGPMIESLQNSKVRIDTPEARKFVPVKLDKAKTFKKWSFYKPALEADAYINIPVAKHHSRAKLTMGLKNVLGIIGGNRGKVHVSLDQGIADLNTARIPTLTVIDGTRILLRNGPSGGNLEDVEVKNTVIASADTVAADAFAARTLFGKDPAEVPYIGIAGEMGLGTADLAKVKVLKV